MRPSPGILALLLLAGTSAPPESSAASLISVFDVPASSLNAPDASYPALSPDARHLYVTTPVAEIDVYGRDPATGLVTPAGTEADGADGPLVVSPDGLHVYALASPDAVAWFSRDGASGALARLGEVSATGGGPAELSAPAAIAVSPDGAHVYVACTGSGAVLAFARDAASGALGFLGATSGLASPQGLALGPDGAQLYVATANDDSLQVFARDPVSGALSLSDTKTDGVGGVSGLAGAHSVAVAPDGGSVYVGGANQVVVFTRDGQGALSFASARTIDSGYTYPSVAVAPEALWVYFTALVGPIQSGGMAQQSVAAFARDAATGAIDPIDSTAIWNIGPPAFGGIAPSADGKTAYVGGPLRVVGLVSSGSLLTPTQTLAEGQGGVSGLDTPVDVIVTRDGRHVIVASIGTPALGVFARDRTSGALGFLEAETQGLASPYALVASLDGRFVYVADAAQGVVVFTRDAASGLLAYSTTVTDGLGASGGARALVIGPGGDQIYALGNPVSSTESMLAAYARDPSSGGLGLIGAPLSAPRDGSLVMTPCGTNVIVSVFGGYVAYGRDPATGALSYAAGAGCTLPGGSGGAPIEVLGFATDGQQAYELVPDAASGSGGPDYGTEQTLYVVDLTGQGASTSIHDRTHGAVGLSSIQNVLGAERALYLSGAESLVAFLRDPASGAVRFADFQPVATGALALSRDGASLYALHPNSLGVYAPEPDSAALAAAAVASLGSLAGYARRRGHCWRTHACSDSRYR